MDSSQGTPERHQDIAASRAPRERAAVTDQDTQTLALHVTAIQVDAHTHEPLPLRALWDQLVNGSWRVASYFSTDARHYFLLDVPAMAEVVRGADLLQRTLLGERQKVVAMDLRCSVSSLTGRLGAVAVKMGLPPGRSRVPPLLVASAVAATGFASLPEARLSHLALPGGGNLLVVSACRLDAPIRALLSPAEWQVACLLLDGFSHQAIAERRGCAVRTVANQISSVFRKLRISGRPELVLSMAVPALGLRPDAGKSYV
jgi:DNA-binding CsgD family transcriptional regulator